MNNESFKDSEWHTKKSHIHLINDFSKYAQFFYSVFQTSRVVLP